MNNKIKLNIIDSLSGDSIFYHEDLTCVNVNRLIGRKNIDKLSLNQSEISVLSKVSEINLCNLSSLVYRLRIKFGSVKFYALINTLVNLFRSVNPKIKFVQRGVHNYSEIDCRPLSNVFLFSLENNRIDMNKTFKSDCNLLGYTDIQLVSMFEEKINLMRIMPEDIVSMIPICNDKNNVAYKFLRGIIDD